MEPHLYLKRGKKNILLVRYFDKLHFVTLDHRMNYKVRPWFLERPRTDVEMDERGLIRTSIDLKEIRGVAAGGTGRGNVVQFYLKDSKKRYELYEDTNLETMGALFHGLESYAPPQTKSNWQDCRMARQNKELRNKLWALGWVLNIASCVSGFLIWGMGFEVGGIVLVSLLCVTVSVALYYFFPDYYTIFIEKRKYGQKKGVMNLLGPLVCPTAMILGAIGCYEIFGMWKAWAIGTAIIVVLAVVLYMTAPVFRDGDKVAMLVIVGLLLSGGPVLALNTLLETAPAREIRTEVVDKEKHTSSKTGDIYELIVILDGEEMDIPVGSNVYSQTEIGDRVTVEFHAGAFGISYVRLK